MIHVIKMVMVLTRFKMNMNEIWQNGYVIMNKDEDNLVKTDLGNLMGIGTKVKVIEGW